MTQITARFDDRKLSLVIEGLPELAGSEKQVAWAAEIRDTAISGLATWFEGQRAVAARQGITLGLDQLNEHAGRVGTLAAKVLARAEARYWIDNRGQDIRVLATR